MLGQQVDGRLRERIALVDPTLPSDVGVNVFRIEPDSLQNSHRLGQNLIADSVPGHRNYGVFRHSLSYKSKP
jgi:hypothetical protein